MSAITQEVEVMADHDDFWYDATNDKYPFGLPEFKGIPWPMPKGFAVGDAVTYSVYPHVINGLGMATRQGILSVGTTYMDVTSAGLCDICEWHAVYEVSHRE